jgi:hypothetical protein
MNRENKTAAELQSLISQVSDGTQVSAEFQRFFLPLYSV